MASSRIIILGFLNINLAINSDSAEFHHIIQRFGMRIINAGIGLVLSLLIVALMQWQIALIMAIIIHFSLIISKTIEAKMKKSSDVLRSEQGKYSAWLMEILKGIREIKLFVAEKSVLKHFVRKNKDIIGLSAKQDVIQFKSTQIINGIYFFADIIFYIICALFVANKSINTGQYVAISFYFSMISSNIKKVLHGNVEYQGRKASIERVIKLLDEEEEDARNLVNLELTEGNIQIENLSFQYEENVDVLKNISLNINSGEKIGVVGESGVGKSTLANLLIKFFTPTDGEIFIDGQPLSNCLCFSVRQNIGIVNQENVVFDGSVRENITFGEEATDEELWDILEKVYLKEEIESLPNGLDTLLWQKNITLSGGQNQRLCIV